MRWSGDSRRKQFGSFVVATLVGVAGARAQGSPRPQVLVMCDELSEETRAAIEVRHLGDMADLPSPGTLRLTCQTDAVIGEWLEGDVVQQQRSVSRAPTDPPTELLHWLASLLIDGRRQADPASVPAQNATDRDTSVSPTPSSTKRSDTAVEHRDTAVEPTEATLEHEQSGVGRPASVDDQAVWGGSLGVRYQHWGTQIAGSLGPVANIERALTPDWSGVIVASWLWGLTSAGHVEANEGSFSAGTEYQLFAEWTVGLAIGVTVLRLRAAEPKPTSAIEVLPALDVTTRVRFPAPAWGAYFDAGMRAVPVSREVRLDGTPTLHIPELRALLSIGVTFTPP